ncbi:MAG: NAD(P)H-dependent flavin oxidoreductase, partial [Rhodospirillaceae bacterium]
MSDAAQERLQALWSRGKDFLGTEHAILGGAMSWVSERHLVAAISLAGGFGVIACGSMTPDLLAAEIDGTRAVMDESSGKADGSGRMPFGVNLITMHPDLDTLIDVCLEKDVSHVVLAGGLPSAKAIRRIKDGGAKVVCFAPALILAKKMIRSGADALVIEGAEAGGHIGPVATSVLAQEILP